MIKTHKIKYDTSKYQFRPLIKKILGEKSLENLHEVKKYERYTEPTDQAYDVSIKLTMINSKKSSIHYINNLLKSL